MATFPGYTGLDSFLRWLQPHLPECPEHLVIDTLRETCIEFCNETEYWQESLIPTALIEGVRDYWLEPINAPSFTEVVRPLSLSVESSQIEPVEEATLADMDPRWREREGFPRRYVVVQGGEIVLDRAPYAGATTNKLRGTLALKPGKDADSVPKWFYDDFNETLVQGTLYRLLRIRNKEWSDMEGSQLAYGMYTKGVNMARARRFHAEGRGSQRARGRRFLARGNR